MKFGMKSVLGAGLVLGAVIIGGVLTQSPPIVVSVNTIEEAIIETSRQRIEGCQTHERLPANISAIRLRADALLGPRVTLVVLADGHVVTRGERGSGWTGGAVTIPVRARSKTLSDVDLCFVLYLNGDETAELIGEQARRAGGTPGGNGALPGRLGVEYLRPSRSSWWSLLPAVARRMSLGRAASGTWSVLVVVGLMASLILVCSQVIRRGLR